VVQLIAPPHAWSATEQLISSCPPMRSQERSVLMAHCQPAYCDPSFNPVNARALDSAQRRVSGVFNVHRLFRCRLTEEMDYVFGLPLCRIPPVRAYGDARFPGL